MSTTNWYEVRNDLALRLATIVTSLRTVKTAPTEEEADTISMSYPGAVVVKGRVRRTSDPMMAPDFRYWCQVEYHVFYYSSEGISDDDSEKAEDFQDLVNAGRLALEAYMVPFGIQKDNSSLLLWDSEDEMEKHGSRGDGTDGLKIKQTFSLDQLTYAVGA